LLENDPDNQSSSPPMIWDILSFFIKYLGGGGVNYNSILNPMIFILET